MNIFNALLINFTTILLSVKDVSQFNINYFSVRNGELTLYIEDFKLQETTVVLYLKGEVNIKRDCHVEYQGSSYVVSYNSLYSTEEFNERYYTDEPLGCDYTPNFTTFSLWSPPAAYVNLLVYQNGDPSVRENPRKFKMTEQHGLWKVKIKGNLKGYFYTYQLKVHNVLNEAVDPYVRAVGINGHRGAIIDLKETDPRGFAKDLSPYPEAATDSIIYEASIRDISIHPDSGIRNKGRYLGLAEDATASSKGVTTGLAHIKELGITHLQLMPVFDFSAKSTDEKNPYKYNWGYDPENYNVPEGVYSSDPYTPQCRINELKKLIQQLHNNKICVVLDVVYNHLYHNTENNFHRIFPGYYFRYDDNDQLSDGSGCGNDTASERPMMRRFFIDSMLYWVKEYHIDGFRVDLMGLHDITTMNEARKALNKIDKRILLYGEGWNLNTFLPDNLKANMNNSDSMSHIGHFNDVIRDTIKGSVFSPGDKGFASGKPGLEKQMAYCVTACTLPTDNGKALFKTPDQSINYVSAHDNYTLWDKLELSNPDCSPEELKLMSKLSEAIILTSQGIPFIHSGAEFCRTKGGINNSYNSTDAVNRLDWNRKLKFLDVVDYYKGLIKLRKEHPAFRMASRNCMKSHLHFVADTPSKTLAFLLCNHANADTWKDILVIYNSKKHMASIKVPDGTWHQVVDTKRAGVEILNSFTTDVVNVEAMSAAVFYRE